MLKHLEVDIIGISLVCNHVYDLWKVPKKQFPGGQTSRSEVGDESDDGFVEKLIINNTQIQTYRETFSQTIHISL